MALIVCAALDPVNVQVFGNWFSFKPGQVKNMDPRIVDFLSIDRKAMGFVSLPPICEDEPDSEEAKAAKADAIVQGRRAIMADLEYRKKNIEVSLQKDLDISGHKVNALQWAAAEDPKGVKELYSTIAKYNEHAKKENQSTMDDILKLKEQIDGNAIGSNSSASS